MSRLLCSGCGGELPPASFVCVGDGRHANVIAVKEAISILGKLTRDDRKKALSGFCRECSRQIERPDWSGRNYCIDCSPDPLE